MGGRGWSWVGLDGPGWLTFLDGWARKRFAIPSCPCWVEREDGKEGGPLVLPHTVPTSWSSAHSLTVSTLGTPTRPFLADNQAMKVSLVKGSVSPNIFLNVASNPTGPLVLSEARMSPARGDTGQLDMDVG